MATRDAASGRKIFVDACVTCAHSGYEPTQRSRASKEGAAAAAAVPRFAATPSPRAAPCDEPAPVEEMEVDGAEPVAVAAPAGPDRPTAAWRSCMCALGLQGVHGPQRPECKGVCGLPGDPFNVVGGDEESDILFPSWWAGTWGQRQVAGA